MEHNMEQTYFNTKEVLTIANNVEDDGCHFYKTMAAQACNKKVKDVFDRFASEEVEHQNHFGKILEDSREELFNFEEAQLFTAYLKEIVETGVFPKKPEYPDLSKGDEKINVALQLGITAEKKSIEFYKHAAAACINDDGREAFLKLMKIEESHLETLQKLLKDN